MRDPLENAINECLLQDQQKLRHRLRSGADKKPGMSAALADDIERARQRFQDRQSAMPVVHFNNDLPIHNRLDDIRRLLEEQQVIIVSGETGSGKTTQLPKLCLAMGRGSRGFIGHTQPRRLAARTVASRIADELESQPGDAVGYKIRHTDKTSPGTYIKLMTDGILLAELQQDKQLLQYDTLIIDEAHERSLNIDFLLGYLKQLLPSRPDLKLIITSATIDVERFSDHFNQAPIIEVSGRTYPVEVRYRPLEAGDGTDTDSDDDQQALLQAVRELSAVSHGDILVFLEGEREIHETSRFLEKQALPDTDILPLYSRLSSVRQARIFQPHKRRHIVLATNVAETSLTIPAIRYVIDRGYARISRYSRRSKVQQLPIEKISQASADQRKGRCGRVADGICIRLYEEADYEARPLFTDPEIIRTNLAAVILQMKALKLGDIRGFPFINKPDDRYIKDGLRLLHELRAIDKAGKLTPLGRQLVRLPLDPRLGCMLMKADQTGCLAEVLIIVSALSGQDPRERPLDMQEKADKAHAAFHDERSDFLALLNIWRFYHDHARQLSQNKLRKLCQQNFLSYVRIREWKEIYQQLHKILSEMNMYLQSEPADYDTIHMALLPALLSHVASKTDDRTYTGARGVKLHIFPGSSQFSKLPRWIVAAELVETSRLYARTVAAINPQWLIKPAEHLLQREIYDPVWDTQSQQVMALEKLGLFGLVLVAGQRVNYGKTHPREARQIFIQEALVGEKLETRAAFYRENHAVVEKLRLLEKKSRRHDVFNERALYEFYDQHLPEDIYNGPLFEKWYQKACQDNPHLLRICEEDIRYHPAEQITRQQFPDRVTLNQTVLPVTYEFEPGRPDDGINLDIPVYLLNQVRPGQLDSMVPGIVEEKITFMLKALPKNIRKKLVPVPDTARECADHIEPGDGLLSDYLAAYLSKSRAVDIPADTWQNVDFPEYLRINIRVRDENEQLLAQGRDLGALQQQLSGKITAKFGSVLPVEVEQTGYTAWDFPDLDEVVVHRVNNREVLSYPALVDKGDTVSVRLFDTRAAAQSYMPAGLRRLFMLVLRREYKQLAKKLPGLDRIRVLYTSIGNSDILVDDLLQVITDRVFLQQGANISSKTEFVRRLEEGAAVLFNEANTICVLVCTILEKWQKCRNLLANSTALPEESAADIREHLDMLVFDGFLHDTPVSLLMHYPRYLDADVRRIEKLAVSPARDIKLQSRLVPFLQACRNLNKQAVLSVYPYEIEQYRFMLEEFRVSLFAQELGTAVKVSDKRLEKLRSAIKTGNG
ncbi:MAG TPA: ATP-dependent RNA helicase HrpA [Gammaproteobacteria bacterium]|nr:ATP-dependent RNA helicase HrpA [Gammaproteobacteria bacterium]